MLPSVIQAVSRLRPFSFAGNQDEPVIMIGVEAINLLAGLCS